MSGAAGATCRLHRVDLRDPATPVDLGCVAGRTTVEDLRFADDRVVAARGAAGVAVAPRTFGTRPAAPPGPAAAAE